MWPILLVTLLVHVLDMFCQEALCEEFVALGTGILGIPTWHLLSHSVHGLDMFGQVTLVKSYLHWVQGKFDFCPNPSSLGVTLHL